jgi:predicted DNA-binding transcriptional regulator YafY
MLALLTAAIEGRRLVSIWYDPGVRVVEPHALGYGSDGQLLLRAFQVAGASASDQPVHWKLFRLDRIKDAKLNGRVFRKPRPEYQRDDRAMTRGIIAQI